MNRRPRQQQIRSLHGIVPAVEIVSLLSSAPNAVRPNRNPKTPKAGTASAGTDISLQNSAQTVVQSVRMLRQNGYALPAGKQE